jgi:hypothetical protein
MNSHNNIIKLKILTKVYISLIIINNLEN